MFEAPHLRKIQLDFSRTVFLQRVKHVCGGQRTQSQPSSPPPPRSPQEAWRGLTEHVLQTDQAGHKVVKVDGEVLHAIASHDGLMQRVVQAETYEQRSKVRGTQEGWGGHQCSRWQLHFAPYQLPPRPSSSQWSSWSQSCPHPSGGRCSVGKKEAGGHGSGPQTQTGGSSETHQEVLDLGPQHLELHQAQFVAAIFLWHQFRSRRLLTFTPYPLNR